MAHIVGSTDTAASAEETWELMSDIHRLPEFVDDIDRMTDVPDGEVGVGCRFRGVRVGFILMAGPHGYAANATMAAGPPSRLCCQRPDRLVVTGRRRAA